MNPLLENLKRKTGRLMQGRYGADQFTGFLTKAALVMMILSLIDALSFLSGWALVFLIYGVFRTMSRNTVKRRAENTAYLQLNYKFQVALSEQKMRWKSRDEYKYFKCKNCKKLLRVPRGRGKLNVTCPQCGHKMIQKS